jgi:SNF2 family DNA or RNA helicase
MFEIPKISFYQEITQYFKQQYDKIPDKEHIKYAYNQNITLFPHQWEVQQYMLRGNRGLLIYHGMGLGKTRTSMITAESLLREKQIRKCVIISPLATVHSFVKELAILRGLLPSGVSFGTLQKNELQNILASLSKEYSFVTLKSINMLVSFERAVKLAVSGKNPSEFDKQLGLFADMNKSLNQVLVVVDESQEFTNAIYNGSNNAMKLFMHILNSEGVRLLFLSGTPMINDVYECALIFNMLRGLRGTISAFSDNPELFHKRYVSNNKMINSIKFKERITGLVSHVKTEISAAQREHMPKQNPIRILSIPMSSFQWKEYISFRHKEIEKEAKSYRRRDEKTSGMFTKVKSSLMSSYRIRSRIVSNFALPERIKTFDSALEQLTKEDLSLPELAIYSPKTAVMLEIINKIPNEDGVILIYSNFTNYGGISMIAQVLEHQGYININKVLDDKSYHTKEHEFKGFVIYTGDVNEQTRTKILSLEHLPDNKNGKYIRIVLLSSCGSLGIDLKHVRNVILFEPYWNMARLYQSLARAIRMNSLDAFPLDMRVVNITLLLATEPGKIDFKKVFGKHEVSTTDVHIYTRALNNQKLLDECLQNIAETSVHCVFDKEILKKNLNCFQCVDIIDPTIPIFETDIAKHFLLTSKCVSMKLKLQKIGTDSYKDIETGDLYTKTDTGEFILQT